MLNNRPTSIFHELFWGEEEGGQKTEAPVGSESQSWLPTKGIIFAAKCFRADVFLVFSQEASCLVLAFACIMRRSWRLIKRWVLPFLPGSSSFPVPGGWVRGRAWGAGAAGAPGCCPRHPGRGRNRGRGSRQSCRPVFLCPTFLLFPPSPFRVHGLSGRRGFARLGSPEV